MREAGREATAPVQWGVSPQTGWGGDSQMQLRWVEKGLSRLEVTDPALEGSVENFLDDECGRSRFSVWLSKPIVSFILDAILKI